MPVGLEPRNLEAMAPCGAPEPTTNVDNAAGPRPFGAMRLVPALLCVAWLTAVTGRSELPRSGPENSPHLGDWVVEQMAGGTVVAKEGALVVEDAGGCTVWYRRPLTAPVEISYDVTVVSRGGPHDRVSDVNCFWMASDPHAPEGCPFAAGHGRSGKFIEYDALQTYYVGMGGNTNSTTRFRRYDGHGAKPLRPEYDLRAKPFLLRPNQTYHLRLVAHDGIAEFWRDGQKLFSFRDAEPLTHGWFAFRTVKSHMEIRNFQVIEGVK